MILLKITIFIIAYIIGVLALDIIIEGNPMKEKTELVLITIAIMCGVIAILMNLMTMFCR